MAQSVDASVSAHAVLLDPAHREILLQRRDPYPWIGQGGLLGLFGGRMEGRETGLACIGRELREELGLGIPELSVISEWRSDLGPQLVFLICVKGARVLDVCEGRLERLTYELAIARTDLTPLAGRSLERYRSSIVEIFEM
jgi:8-oxo-dGTP pyrophosphatase MutT (NUDIX family)